MRAGKPIERQGRHVYAQRGCDAGLHSSSTVSMAREIEVEIAGLHSPSTVSMARSMHFLQQK